MWGPLLPFHQQRHKPLHAANLSWLDAQRTRFIHNSCLLPLRLCRCGTAGSYTMPRPGIDPRGSLTPQERLKTPYDWFVSPTCRQQVGTFNSRGMCRVGG